MEINNTYNNGQIVFLITDPDQCERIVTCIQVYPNGGIMYQLSYSSNSSWHYDCEISNDKDIVKGLSS